MNRSRVFSYLHNSLFVLLLACCMVLLAWLSTRNDVQWDLTSEQNYTLSEDGQKLIALAKQPLRILAFAGDHATERRIRNFVGMYQAHKDNIELEFIDPLERPDEVNRYKISALGELVIIYGGRQSHLHPQGKSSTAPIFREARFNAVLQNMIRETEQVIYFIEGHGERPIEGVANHGLSAWAEVLRKRGFAVSTHVISADEALPDDANLVVLSTPQLDWLLPELLVLRQYVERGGALLWLHEPGAEYGMQPLMQFIGIGFAKEPVFASKLLPGSGDTSLISPELQAYNSKHPVLRDFSFRILFPQPAEVVVDRENANPSWVYTPLIKVDNRKKTIAMIMTRPIGDSKAEQRMAIFGDGDFLSNTFLPNGGNGELGVRLVDWLTSNDSFISVLEDAATDTSLSMSERTRAAFALSYLLGLPVLLLIAAWLMHIRRKL